LPSSFNTIHLFVLIHLNSFTSVGLQYDFVTLVKFYLTKVTNSKFLFFIVLFNSNLLLLNYLIFAKQHTLNKIYTLKFIKNFINKIIFYFILKIVLLHTVIT